MGLRTDHKRVKKIETEQRSVVLLRRRLSTDKTSKEKYFHTFITGLKQTYKP